MKLPLLTTSLVLVLAAPLVAAPPATSSSSEADELAKQLNNLVASLISVPFQANWDFGSGDGSGQKFTLNIQPVIPLSIGEDWNIIIRTILPVIDQDGVFGPNSGHQSGLGNTTQKLLFLAQGFRPRRPHLGPRPGGLLSHETPTGGPEWGIRADLTLLFPTGKHEAPAAPSYKK